ncbi:MAG: hypothetical protein RMK19_01155 [Bacteroidia bacterium]|nr:hypothetical protein [Bacteroidia bacterium]
MKQREVARGALWNGIGYILGGLLGVSYPLLLLHWLGRSGYGVVSYIALLVNQSYLFNLGLGEAMAQRLTASVSRGEREKGIAYIQSGLLGVWLITLGLSLFWVLLGVRGLATILPLTSGEALLLSEARTLVPFGFWGMQTGMFLSWVPIAVGDFRWAALNSIFQTLWQALFPLLLLFLSGEPSPSLALRWILIGYLGYGINLWLFTAYRLRWHGLPGRFHLIPSLLQHSIWIGLQGLLGLPLSFFERTLVAQWDSLSLMGFYSAIHYLGAKVSAFALKIFEALFPVFGAPQESLLRQGLRLSQTIWLVSLIAGVGGLGGWGVLSLVLPLLPTHIGPAEKVLMAGAIGSLLCYLPGAPLSIFHQSQGHFRALFWMSSAMMLLSVLLTPFLVAQGLFFFPSIFGSLLWMGLNVLLLTQKRSIQVLWRYWVYPTYFRVLGYWGIGALLFTHTFLESIAPIILFLISLVFMISELRGRKRVFLRQLFSTLWGLSQTAIRRFSRPFRQASLNDR